MRGGVIIPPIEGLQQNFDKVLITTTVYGEEIRTQLTDTFFVPNEKICLWWDITQMVYTKIYERKQAFWLHHKPTIFVPEAVISDREKPTEDIGL